MTSTPVHPFPWQGIPLTAGLLAGEYAVSHLLGEEIRHVPFDELIEDAQIDEEGGTESDALLSLRLLREVAESPVTKRYLDQMKEQAAMLDLPSGTSPSLPLPPWEDAEESYKQACEEAARNVKLFWPEIEAVAEKLMEKGCLDGEECVAIIESTSAD